MLNNSEPLCSTEFAWWRKRTSNPLLPRGRVVRFYLSCAIFFFFSQRSQATFQRSTKKESGRGRGKEIHKHTSLLFTQQPALPSSSSRSEMVNIFFLSVSTSPFTVCCSFIRLEGRLFLKHHTSHSCTLCSLTPLLLYFVGFLWQTRRCTISRCKPLFITRGGRRPRPNRRNAMATSPWSSRIPRSLPSSTRRRSAKFAASSSSPPRLNCFFCCVAVARFFF